MVDVGQIVCPNCGNAETFEVTRYIMWGATLYLWEGDGYEAIEADGGDWGRVDQLLCTECNTVLDDSLLEKLERSVSLRVA